MYPSGQLPAEPRITELDSVAFSHQISKLRPAGSIFDDGQFSSPCGCKFAASIAKLNREHLVIVFRSGRSPILNRLEHRQIVCAGRHIAGEPSGGKKIWI
jgi:hypothetical protein